MQVLLENSLLGITAETTLGVLRHDYEGVGVWFWNKISSGITKGVGDIAVGPSFRWSVNQPNLSSYYVSSFDKIMFTVISTLQCWHEITFYL